MPFVRWDITIIRSDHNRILTDSRKQVESGKIVCSLSEEAVNVYRTASRIDLEQISVSWSGDNAADLKEAKARFHLKRIYVIDAKNATCLADHSSTDASVELTGEGRTFLHGREAGENYFSGLDLFPAVGENGRFAALQKVFISLHLHVVSRPTTLRE